MCNPKIEGRKEEGRKMNYIIHLNMRQRKDITFEKENTKEKYRLGVWGGEHKVEKKIKNRLKSSV